MKRTTKRITKNAAPVIAEKTAVKSAAKALKAQKPAPAAAKPAREPKEQKPEAPATAADKPEAQKSASKTQTILGLLQRDGGATSPELMSATGWQAHSVRGFLSAVVAKKLGLALTSTRNDAGQRTYAVTL